MPKARNTQIKDTGFGKSDEQLAEAFGVSVSEIKKIKKQITSEITNPAPKKPLTGPAAVAALKNQVSPKGVAAAEATARKAIEKKYPGLYVPQTRVAKTADTARTRNQAKYGM